MSTEWTFRLVVNNRTDETFKIINKDASWGLWYRNSKDEEEPIDILPQSNTEVFAIRASKGTWTGYQGTCTWAGKDGTLTLMIEVPYNSSKNHGSFHNTTHYIVDGWEELADKKHQFIQTITIDEL